MPSSDFDPPEKALTLEEMMALPFMRQAPYRNKHALTFQVQLAQYRYLEKIAKEKGWTMSQIGRVAILQYLRSGGVTDPDIC